MALFAAFELQLKSWASIMLKYWNAYANDVLTCCILFMLLDGAVRSWVGIDGHIAKECGRVALSDKHRNCIRSIEMIWWKVSPGIVNRWQNQDRLERQKEWIHSDLRWMTGSWWVRWLSDTWSLIFWEPEQSKVFNTNWEIKDGKSTEIQLRSMSPESSDIE